MCRSLGRCLRFRPGFRRSFLWCLAYLRAFSFSPPVHLLSMV
uniref:Uncharacterized protein n=1 Tax=Myoviridae sp. ct9Uc11 TaxID=2825042 RepID=A0A8S5U977_9CAUD|nr:MAG TPA: hypothetical protein [Myoviridae sp. ct9Uc11]